MEKISFKGVIIGAIVDVVLTNIFGFFLGIYIAIQYKLFTIPSDQITQRMTHIIQHDPGVFLTSFIIGGGFTVLGGYIAARIAKKNELLNGTVSSFICILLGLMSFNSSPIHMIILGILISPLLGLLGGYLRTLQSPIKASKSKKKSLNKKK